MNAISFYRVEHWLWKKKVPILPAVIHNIIFLMLIHTFLLHALLGKVLVLLMVEWEL